MSGYGLCLFSSRTLGRVVLCRPMCAPMCHLSCIGRIEVAPFASSESHSRLPLLCECADYSAERGSADSFVLTPLSGCSLYSFNSHTLGRVVLCRPMCAPMCHLSCIGRIGVAPFRVLREPLEAAIAL